MRFDVCWYSQDCSQALNSLTPVFYHLQYGLIEVLVEEIASSIQFLHSVSNQKLESGGTWERS